MKKFIIILSAFIISLFTTNFANAENFYINTYNVKMNITEDRTAEITEDIDVMFTYPSHGIFRNIPFKNTISREDGTINNETARISDISATQLFRKEIDRGYLILKMGNPNLKIEGKQSYKISYKYDMGNDKVKDADEFYFNIIGTEWDTTIRRVYFTITLPKEFDANKVGFSLGTNGSVGYNPDDLKFRISGNTITGYTKTTLNPHEGLTIRVELPENYFTPKIGFETYIALIAVVLAIIPLVIWYIFGKDDPVTPIVNFSAPEGKNSAEIEVEYKGNSSSKGVISLIFYLASKGYIEIEDDGINFIINKLKPYDGTKSTEKAMMEALFYGEKDSVSQIQLSVSSVFRLYCQRIQKCLNKIRGFLFEKDSCSVGKIAILIISIIGLLGLLIYTLGDYSFCMISGGQGVIFIFPVIAVIVMASLISASMKNIIFALAWGLPFGGIPLCFIISEAPNISNNAPILLLQLACLIVSFICLVNMPKRNTKGRMLLGQVLGLKKFIEVVEKPRLLALIQENPNYVNEILPYAYVLGVENHLLDCIEEYDDYQPTWYHGRRLNSSRFEKISSSLSTAASPPSSSHSGGSGHSGGGHSGGGHGGGGGGSW